ncbi:MAG: class I SAM-dependent rRNA methyltransferase [Acidobacteriota bacterium]
MAHTKHVILKKNEDRRLKSGHQWVFSNEIHRIVGAPEAGDLVEILRADGLSLGVGFYHPNSLIAVRLLSAKEAAIDAGFFEARIRSALALRETLFPGATTYRVVHGEGDYLPGLIVDRFNEYLSVQTFTAGMDLRLGQIADALVSIFAPRGIVERNESPLRLMEQLPMRRTILRGVVEHTIIDLHGVKFNVEVMEGQKSGFFLDQRENRASLASIAKGATVLDCFCNEGGFGMHAAAAGAAHVDFVDASEESIAKAKVNATLNKVTDVHFDKADAFEYLPAAVGDKKQYDIVVLDPPSFTKSRKTVATALRGYKEINSNGMRLVKPGGFLATASCSHHVDEPMFLSMVGESAQKAGRQIQVVSVAGAAGDHPTLPSMPETKYLKYALVRVY